MIKKVILGLGLVSMMAFSGCTSDTKEDIIKDAKALVADCMTGKLSQEECAEKGKAIDERKKAFEKNNK